MPLQEIILDLIKELKKVAARDISEPVMLRAVNTLIVERLQENTVSVARRYSEEWCIEKAKKPEERVEFEFWVIAKLAEIQASNATNTEADRAMGKVFGVVR